MADSEVHQKFEAACQRHIPGAGELVALKRLSGGASQETWAADLELEGAVAELIIRRGPGGKERDQNPNLTGNETEARLVQAAYDAGVKAPRVRAIFDAADGVGSGFVMDRIEGETLAPKILRGEEFAQAREIMASQCGEIAAAIHAMPMDSLPELNVRDARSEFIAYQTLYKDYNDPRPIFAWAFTWLQQNVPDQTRQTFVHGDFRLGNLMVGTDGVRAVLDWELGHIGDPMEDLGWICMNSWRFGQIDKPVGGFGQREDLYAAYETASGVAVDPAHVRFWEVFGSLKWGVMCMTMVNTHLSGQDRSVERATIGRRSSETEMDLVRLLGESMV